jgi:AcrR family transcriptional regulator
MGLREAKKQKNRATISRLATRLFIERGYDAVTTAEIAALAEVSVPTLFKYFPTKEALVFDEDAEREQALVDAVKNRRRRQTILDALQEMGLKKIGEIQGFHKKETRAFLKLTRETPQLSLYAQQMWLRHEKALATALRRETKNSLTKAEGEAVARFVLDAFHRAITEVNPSAALKKTIQLLRQGWDE